MADLTLHQRLAAIEAEVGRIKPTGQNEYKKPALSIGDVEDALRPLFAKYRVVTRWQRISLDRLADRLWRAELACQVTNADDPTDCFEAAWEDVGSNPSAAYSFVRKGYYKALLHLADDDEGAPTTEPTRQHRADPRSKDSVKPPMSVAQRIAMVCRDAGIDRRELRKALTGKEHTEEITPEQAEHVLEVARRIQRRELQFLLIGDEWAVVENPPGVKPDGVG